jgi:type I restriction enzyme S subunit
MEVKPASKLTETNKARNAWRGCDISDLCLLQRGFDITEATRKAGTIPVYSSSGLSYFHNEARLQPPAVITGRKGILGKVFYVEEPCWPHDTTLWVKDFKGNDPRFVHIFLGQFRLERFDAATSVPTLNRNNLVGIPIRLPQPPEQRAIAGALSDVDALLGALDQLIAKKRDLKQAAMQQLLTGQTRLPGFHGEWDVETVAEIATISKGMQLHSSETNPDGHFPHFNGGISASSYTDKSNTPANTIAISEGGNSCGYVQFMLQPFWCGGHCYAVVPQEIDNQFLYHALKGEQTTIMGLRVGSGLPNIQKTALAAFKLNVPSERAEQTAIAEVLTDLDAELAALEQRRAKTRALKQGMMQELLTGRTAGMSNQKQTQGGQRPALDGSGGPDGFGAVAVNRAVR